MASTDNRVYSLTYGIAYQRAAGEVFVVTADNRLHDIRDNVGIFLFLLLEQNALSLDNLVERCMEQFEVEPAVAKIQIQSFLDEGVEKGLFRVFP
ncbi:MAG: PqqD family protein [Myxococcales bacterium]|nr:PqqD family protein [Myxococcales bacterium]